MVTEKKLVKKKYTIVFVQNFKNAIYYIIIYYEN